MRSDSDLRFFPHEFPIDSQWSNLNSLGCTVVFCRALSGVHSRILLDATELLVSKRLYFQAMAMMNAICSEESSICAQATVTHNSLSAPQSKESQSQMRQSLVYQSAMKHPLAFGAVLRICVGNCVRMSRSSSTQNACQLPQEWMHLQTTGFDQACCSILQLQYAAVWMIPEPNTLDQLFRSWCRQSPRPTTRTPHTVWGNYGKLTRQEERWSCPAVNPMDPQQPPVLLQAAKSSGSRLVFVVSPQQRPDVCVCVLWWIVWHLVAVFCCSRWRALKHVM